MWIRLTIIIIFYYYFYQCPTHISRHRHWLWRKQIVGWANLCPNRILQESEVRDLSSKYPPSKNSHSIVELIIKITLVVCIWSVMIFFFLQDFFKVVLSRTLFDCQPEQVRLKSDRQLLGAMNRSLLTRNGCQINKLHFPCSVSENSRW